MSGTLFRYVARLYLLLAVGIWVSLTLVFLVVDFGDRLRAFVDHPAYDVARLYWYRSMVVLQQLGPAALLLAGGTTVTILRRRSEWVAMQAVGASRWAIVGPVLACALTSAVGLTVFDELVVTDAGTRVDHLMVHTFHRWGDYRFFYSPKRWFRVEQHVFHVRGDVDDDGTLHDVSVFTMGQGFTMIERIDADTMRAAGGTAWALTNAVARRFDGQTASSRESWDTHTVTFDGTSPDTFRVRTGRPELMQVRDLLEQQATRAKVGLPTQRFWLALHNRFAYPLVGVAASLVAASLALRRARRGHLTLALVEGLLVAVALFALLLVGKALVLGDHLPPFAAAWAPVAGLFAGAFGLSWFDERN